MKIQKQANTDERLLLTAMVCDTAFLSQVAPLWTRDGLFAGKWANLIGNWCVQHYTRHNAAPAHYITGIYERWSARPTVDPDTAAMVGTFLDSISQEYARNGEAPATGYLLDRAAEYFRVTDARRHAQAVLDDLDAGDTQAALTRLDAHTAPLLAATGLGPLLTPTTLADAFTAKQAPLIAYPTILGDFFGDTLERDALVAFMGVEKRGKTWWLIDVAWQALLQRRRVAFFEVGDLSRSQLVLRLAARAAGRPYRATAYEYPTAMRRTDKAIEVKCESRRTEAPLTQTEAAAAWEEVLLKQVKTRGNDYFYGQVTPTGTTTAADIRGALLGAAGRGWVADVVVVDYPGILAHPPGVRERRDALNETWSQLRALSQELHCLVVTATQAKATAYNAGLLGMEHFSEDKRILAHVTGMVGINGPRRDDHAAVQRLNWIVRREGRERRVANVAGCLAAGRPWVRACF